MANESTEIGACFWSLGRDENETLTSELVERLRADGTDVEAIDGEVLSASLSLEDLSDSEARLEAICYVVIRLQKHGVIPVLHNHDCSPEELSTINDRLEKMTFLVGDEWEHAADELTNTVQLDSDKAVDDMVSDILEHVEQRGLFAGGVSDQRSDEEVTDRLKNLGYI